MYKQAYLINLISAQWVNRKQNGEQLSYKYYTFASFPTGSSLLKPASDLKNRFFFASEFLAFMKNVFKAYQGACH